MIYYVNSSLFRSFLNLNYNYNHNLFASSSASYKCCRADKIKSLSVSLPACDLPVDIVIDILSRLPVQSIMRFRHVHKSWHALFGDPGFISLHFDQTRMTNSEHVIVEVQDNDRTSKSLYSARIVYNKTGNQPQPSLLKSMPMEFKVEACSDGVICLHNLKSAAGAPDIYFWNPAVKKVKLLPNYDRCARDRLGFGFLPHLNDFKVVKMVYTEIFDETLSIPVRFTPEVEVLSFSSNSWKRISQNNVIPCMTFDEVWTFVHGAVHWRVFNTTAETHILAFDMTNEVFNRIDLPDCYRGFELRPFVHFMPKRLGESLSILVPMGEWCHIWVMKEYGSAKSWSLQHKLAWCSPGIHIFPTDFIRSGEFMFQARTGSDRNKLLMMNPDKRRSHHLTIGTDGEIYDFDAYLCSENLVLLDGGEDMAQHSELFGDAGEIEDLSSLSIS